MADTAGGYGNPTVRVDEYGNPIHDQHGTAGTGTGTGTGGVGGDGTTTTTTTTTHEPRQHHGVSGMLHRSGSSSSSSSEDDGNGGRRKKKGLKEKVLEKIPGTGHKVDGTHAAATTTTTIPSGDPCNQQQQQVHFQEEQHGKKGVMDKIKEKLPGSHHP